MTRDDQVVGFLTVAHHFEAVSEITWLAVHARHRGQGIGRAAHRPAQGHGAAATGAARPLAGQQGPAAGHAA